MTFFPWRDAPEGDFAVIGDPIAHSLSPRMHSAAYAALGLPYRYVAVHVPRGQVSEALTRLSSLGYKGVNVTVPHKKEALLWAMDVEPLAMRVQAANTLRLEDQACINTDAPGFLDTLAGYHFERKSVLVLGAGGTARALVVALMDAGFEVALYNRTTVNAVALAEEIGLASSSVRGDADPSGASLILNTTSASLNNERLPVLWDRAEPDALAYDMMYTDGLTEFLAFAAEWGLRTLDGRRMLVAQGARSFEWWLSLEAPRQAMLEAIL